ncbi:MAG: replicative DNA helicase [Bacteroidia bacterium]
MDNPSKSKRNYTPSMNKALVGDVAGRTAPHSTELEEAVLGAILLEKEAMSKVADILTRDHFYHEANALIYNSILQIYAAGSSAIDLLTVSNHLRNEGKLELAGGNLYLAMLTNKVSSAANIEFHARILTQKFIQRSLIRVSGEIATEAYNDAEDAFLLLNRSEEKLFEIKNSGLKRSFQEIGSLVNRAFKSLEERSKSETIGITGVPSGFSDLDRMTSGWQPSDLIILAARPAMGKTAFALSLLRNAAVEFGKSVVIFSLEMADVQLVNRLVSGEADIPGEKIKKANLTVEEWNRLHQKTSRLTESKIFIDDTPQLNILEMMAKCRRIHAQNGLDMILVDYLQLLRHETNTKSQSNREQEIAFISRSLKSLAKELNVPVIALAQLSREVEKRNNKHPQLSDLRESGSIEQDADMVMFLYREDYYSRMGMESESQHGHDIQGLTEVIIAKHRSGEVGTAMVKFQHEVSKFVDLDATERDLLRNKDGGGFSQPYVTTVPSKMNDSDPFKPDSGGWGGGFSPNISIDE